MYRFEIFRDSSRQYRFRFAAPNGEIMFQSESYTRKSKAKEAIDTIGTAILSGSVEYVDLTSKAK